MTAHVPRLTTHSSRPHRARAAAAWTLALTAGIGLLAAGCSSGGASLSGTSAGASGNGAGAGGIAAPAPAEHAALGRPATRSGAGASAAGRAGLTALPLPGGQSIIFTATLTLRAENLQATVARATQLAEAAGGYVSGEHATMTQSRHARAVVSIQFKVPAAVYQTTLGALGSLGTQRSETQQAQDVTGAVADVDSRVTSAKAAIAQLRDLLTRAGSVGGLLSVQDQINQEEATLEALQSQQRALARETSYATISMTITGPPPAHHRRHAHKAAAGFLSGLTAGWRALRAVVAALLTVAGAVLPFAIPLALVALATIAARRWLGRRRAAGARPAD
jgi:hypothetical protein